MSSLVEAFRHDKQSAPFYFSNAKSEDLCEIDPIDLTK